MQCPVCKTTELEKVFTAQGVIVDYCPQCKGIWFDKGELFYFTSTPKYLRLKLEEALKQPPQFSGRLSPKTSQPMLKLEVFPGLTIDYCPETQGIWLDFDLLEKIPYVKSKGLNISFDKQLFTSGQSAAASRDDQGPTSQTQQEQPRLDVLPRLPNLSVASIFTLAGLYAMLYLILILCIQFFNLSSYAALLIGVGFAVFQFILGPFVMDWILRTFYSLVWIEEDALPVGLKEFIRNTCREKGMKFPRIGIINDGSPQAFTYGHVPDNARIVISRGLQDLLQPEELEAVVAHEIGHAVHWDMLIMTCAYLVPLILYYIYKTLIRTRGSGKGKAPQLAIAIASYILYIISEYLVLFFSRIREYYADRFSGEVTKNPGALASALVKIGYGLAGRVSAGEGSEKGRNPRMQAIGAMGIFDSRTVQSLVVTGFSAKMGGQVDKNLLKEAMKWDLWNPWALYFELHSTHPLIAKRLNRLSEQAMFLGKPAYVVFDQKRPESYWDEFCLDFLIQWLPFFSVLMTGLVFREMLSGKIVQFAGVLLGAYSFSALLRTLIAYDAGADFPEMTIAGLLKKVKVSPVRPVPCTIKGKLIGRGVPGLIWSEDFILQDDSGIMFLDYRQPLGIWNFFFGLLSAGALVGREVQIKGWYRRAPIPYIEIRKMIDLDGSSRTCYTYPVKIGFYLALIALSIFLFIKGNIFF